MKIQVDEDRLHLAIDIYRQMNEGANPVAMLKAIDRGGIFREEGLTPAYIIDDVTGSIVVTSEEFLDNKLH